MEADLSMTDISTIWENKSKRHLLLQYFRVKNNDKRISVYIVKFKNIMINNWKHCHTWKLCCQTLMEVRAAADINKHNTCPSTLGDAGCVLFSLLPLSLTLSPCLALFPLAVLSVFINSPRSSLACWLYSVKLQRMGQHGSTLTCDLKACELILFQGERGG